jgi:DNA-binding NarL/FixJ family response regulator
MKTAVLVDDHVAFRSLLKKQLKGFSVVGEAGNGLAALEMVRNTKPDLVILDLSMPNRSGLSIIPDLISAESTIKILILTIHNSAEVARTAFDMGASGYCLKDEGIKALRSAIAAVMRGERYISPLLKNDKD